ncbi:MAG: SDR family NAD(P)-dependent oxidoreductase [Deltaproteobacteria bacterium]|nr:SDR family NAD(P)-dependent oxidoreductase [Deltaproteobacteria bacterium]
MLAILRGSEALANFVFVSTIGAVDRAPGDDCRAPLTTRSVPNPRSEYGRSKLLAEGAVRASGLPFTIVRPTWVYGPGMRPDSHVRQFAEWLWRGLPPGLLGLPGAVSVIHVADLARALCNVIDNRAVIGKTYFAETEEVPIGAMLRALDGALHGRERAQVPWPDARAVIGRLHPWLPVGVSSLGAAYLTASDPGFREDLRVSAPVRFRDGVRDVARDVRGESGAYVITGAAGGIGRALTRLLESRGRSLVLIDRDPRGVESPERHTVIEADLSDPAQVAAVADRLNGLAISCLINNAGVGFRRSLRAMTERELAATIDVNVRGTMLLTRLVLDRLVHARASIANVASSVAYNPLPGMAAYAASKAMVASWSEALAHELRDTNHVLTFSPAGTRTGFQEKAGVATDRDGLGLLSPDEVAARLLLALDRREHSVVVGRNARLLLSATRWLPRKLNAQLWGLLFERTR